MTNVKCEWLQPVLVVPSVKDPVQFYTEKLGFEVEFLWGDPPTHAGVTIDGKTIQLSEGTGSKGAATSGTDTKPASMWLYLSVWDAPKLLRVLTEHEVDFAIVGGLAGVMHGAPIHTQDLDVLYSLQPPNLRGC